MNTVPVTVLLPAYNEEPAIGIVIGGIRRAMAPLSIDHEILVVDDGSTDGTAQAAASLGARVHTHPRRAGAGAAIRTGILLARGESIVLLDSDGTYPADAIPSLLRGLESCRQVVGSRTSEEGTWPALRSAVKWALRKLGEFLVRHPIPDLNSGMRAFRKRDALAFLHLLPDGHSCVSTLTLCFLGMGLPVRFEPIPYRPRIGRSKFRVIRDTLRFGVQILRSVTYFAPLRIYLSAALFLFLAGAAKSALDIWRRGGLEESDILLFLFSALAGLLGLLADLIVRQSRKSILDSISLPDDPG